VFKGVVVDRALFAFAAAQPTARLSTILHCALPFSCGQPYTIAAGEVPPEMFFGRGRELESLAEPRGSCFVYGGRQLGKTALLRALERRFHNLQQGRAAIFVDLKRELFSRGRPMDDLWSVLVTRLKDVGVLGDKVGPSAGQEALFRHINDWLSASPDRRLLLLLDEADSFLEQDGKQTDHYEPFPRCQRLKGLMDDTGRRFKVVFAGLHNVQRTTRFSNHPLAHFGDAICIGPMLEEAESREARALVEQPMAAAGYDFASADVVSRILALTNYYPSLIQLFCHHLLRDLRANHVTRFPNARHTPPCVITSNHVQSVYGTSVRQRIHEKVRLTLDLDKRYEVIAYLLAFYNSMQSGLDQREIRADASAYWPAGFADMRTDDEFRGLLEEMVGLGILRQVAGTSKFALRNENVSTLLGTQEEIMRHLESAKDWEPALKYEADKFRRLLTEKPKLTFSPLTAQQEGELKAAENRVAILHGLSASGIAEVPAAMESESLFGKARTTILTDCQAAQALSDRIAHLDRPPRSHSLVLVPSEIPWDETWVAAACQRIGQFTSKDAFVTVLFICGPDRTAATLQGMDGAADLGVRQITLRPWHSAAVRQWLQDLSLDSEQATRDEIYNVTGNWPALLTRLNISSNDALRRSCEDLRRLLQDPVQLAELRSVFGLSSDGADEPLRVAAELKHFTSDEVCEFASATEPAAREHVTARVQRADRLGLVSVAGGAYEFDPVAANILLNSPKTS
jgi:AAA domain